MTSRFNCLSLRSAIAWSRSSMPVGFIALPLLGRAHLNCEIALALPFEHPRLAAAASLT
jgi:hypothetical protein